MPGNAGIVREGEHARVSAAGQRRDGGRRLAEKRAQEQTGAGIERLARRLHGTIRRVARIAGQQHDVASADFEQGQLGRVQHVGAKGRGIAGQRQQQADLQGPLRPRRYRLGWSRRLRERG